MAKKDLKKFHVLNFNFSTKDKKEYDVLPYFRDLWKSKSKFDKDERSKIVDKKTLRDWIRDKSQYKFWGRCEWEHLMAPWPFGSYRMKEDLKKFLTPDFDIEDYSQSIDFYNIIIEDMVKIDVHEQIMMNIDIITDILFDEFKIGEKK